MKIRNISAGAFFLVALAVSPVLAEDPVLTHNEQQFFLNLDRNSLTQADAQNFSMIFGKAPKQNGAMAAFPNYYNCGDSKERRFLPSLEGQSNAPENRFLQPCGSPFFSDTSVVTPNQKRNIFNMDKISDAQMGAQNLKTIFGEAPKLKGNLAVTPDHIFQDDSEDLKILPSVTILGGLGNTPENSIFGSGGAFAGFNIPFDGSSQELGSLSIEGGFLRSSGGGYDRVITGPLVTDSGMNSPGFPWEAWYEAREMRIGERLSEIAGATLRSPLFFNRLFVDASIRVAKRSSDLRRMLTETSWRRDWSPTAIRHTHQQIIDRYSHWHEGNDHWHEGDSHWHRGRDHRHADNDHQHPGFDHQHEDFLHEHAGELHRHQGDDHWHEGFNHQHEGYYERHPGYNHEHLVTRMYTEFHPGWNTGLKDIRTQMLDIERRNSTWGAAYAIGGGFQIHKEVAIKGEFLYSEGWNGVRFGLHFTPGAKD